MNTLVIGAVTGYNYHDIEPWLVSLKRSGYDGRIALVVYNMDADTAKKLTAEGVYILAFSQDVDGNIEYPSSKNFNIVVERFGHMWYFLQQMTDVDYVIATDVRDVIFQRNPLEYINVNDISNATIVCGENFNYENEVWSKNNIINSFGPLSYERIKNTEIICAGVIAAPRKEFIDMCQIIFLLCRGTSSFVNGGGGPDQAALNIFLNNIITEEIIFTDIHDDWCVHLGTSKAAIEAGSGDIGFHYVRSTEKPELKFNRPDNIKLVNDLVVNTYDEPYAIVHQYNRIPEWNKIIDKKYRG